jgi:hypothetical protein
MRQPPSAASVSSRAGGTLQRLAKRACWRGRLGDARVCSRAGGSSRMLQLDHRDTLGAWCRRLALRRARLRAAASKSDRRQVDGLRDRSGEEVGAARHSAVSMQPGVNPGTADHSTRSHVGHVALQPRKRVVSAVSGCLLAARTAGPAASAPAAAAHPEAVTWRPRALAMRKASPYRTATISRRKR